MRNLILAGTVATLAACGGTDAPPVEGDAVAQSGGQRHLGLFTAGEVVEFESCTGEAYGVDGPRIADLVSMHADLTPGLEPFEAVFIDVIGEVVDGPGAGTLEVLELRRVAYEGGGCERDDSRVFFRGSGVEPDWNVVIGEDGLTWTTAQGTEQMAHGGLYDGNGGEWMFDGLDATDAPVMTATIVQTPCVEPMSGAWSHLSISVDRGGESWAGCAYMSPDVEGGA